VLNFWLPDWFCGVGPSSTAIGAHYKQTMRGINHFEPMDGVYLRTTRQQYIHSYKPIEKKKRRARTSNTHIRHDEGGCKSKSINKEDAGA
jgi:hypothetical protein